MLPPAVPLSDHDAQRWIQAGVPRWITSIGLTSLWVLTCAISFISDNTQCTASDPSVCGPDPVASAWSVLLFATPILLVWLPILGCVAGLAFGLADFHYDPVPVSGWAFGLHAVLCGLVALWLVRSAVRQRQIADDISGWRASAPAQPAASRRDGRLTTAGWLALAGVALLCWYGHEVRTEQAHLNRAVRVAARVTGYTDDGSLVLQTGGVGAPQRQLTVDVVDEAPYPVGSLTPVLLDPQDEHWARLVAEPQDATGWLVAGLAAWLLATVLASRAQQWRWQLGSLQSGEWPLLRVRMMLDDDGRALIMPSYDDQRSGDPRVIGRLAIATAGPAQATWQPADQAEFGRSWREDRPAPVAAGSAEHPVRDAVLLGELRDRGVAMLLTADGALHAAGRLRVGRPPPRIVDAFGAMLLRMSFQPSAAERVLTGEPVEESWLRGSLSFR